MGCIKTNRPIKINNRESIKNNELEQKKLISTYVSSSQCGESEASSNNLSIKNKSDNNNNDNENKNKNDDKIIISENSEKSENSEIEKDSQEEKDKG